MATRGRKQTKKTKHLEDKSDLMKAFDFTLEEENKFPSSEDDIREDETPVVDKLSKKRPSSEFEEEEMGLTCGDSILKEENNLPSFPSSRNDVQTMLEKFGADMSKVMQAKRKRLESITKTSLKGTNQKLEQLWKTQYTQRQKLSQEYSLQVSSVLQQWEVEAQKSGDQEEKLNNLFRQQQKLLQQAKVVQNQKIKIIKELYEQFAKNMEEMETGHQAFLQGAQVELKKEMTLMQKKILMDTQQQEMATVRKSLHSMLF